MADAFRNVVRAEVNRSKMLNEARSYENQITNKANAEASAAVSIAESDRTRMVKSVAADATRFQGLRSKYESNPDLFRQQQMVQTMSRVLTNASEKIYVPSRADGKSRELRLLLNREPPKPRIEETKP